MKSEPLGRQPDPEQALTRSEAVLQLREGLRKLPLRDREVLKLAFFDEQDSSELSIQLRVSRTYARVLVHRALGKLRESVVAMNRERLWAA